MPKNFYKPLNEEETPASIVSPTKPQIPSITRPEKVINPEVRKERFRRLAGILRKPSI